MYKKTEAQRGKLNRPRPHSSEGLCFWAGGGQVLCTLFSRVLQPSSHDRALQRKSSKKALLLESSSRLPSDRLLPPRPRPGPLGGLPTPAPRQRPLPCTHGFPENSPSLGRPPPLLPSPTPGMAFASFLLGEQLPVAPGPGSEAPHQQGLPGPAGSLRAPFTHCTSPHPEAEGHVSSH